MESSLWDEPDPVVKVFLTMLAMKDSDNIVRLTAYQIAKKSNKTETEVLEALKVLSSPDTRRVEPQEFEGRRIEAVEEGWLILNGEKYRQKVAEEMKRARNRRSQAAWRARQKTAQQFPAPNPGLPGERRATQAHQQGDEEGFNRAVTDHLPPEPPTEYPET